MSQTDILNSPFPYFGGKRTIAATVWQRFGTPDNYCEPFFGSGAVLLGCPHPGHTETVNDADGLLANFWRATRAAPEEVAHYADWPVNEADLHARHRWLVDRRTMVEQLMADPEWYDAQAAGWWVWGISQWIGSGWCPRPNDNRLSLQMPHVGDDGRGVHRLSLHVGNADQPLHAYFRALAARLRRTRVTCGDFARILGPSVTYLRGRTAIFLDPPYADAEHAIAYSGGGDVWDRVCRWCEANGANPLLRIALCGYADTWQPPAGWTSYRWGAGGGFAGQGAGRGQANATRETIWFSPHCIDMDALPLFAYAAQNGRNQDAH